MLQGTKFENPVLNAVVRIFPSPSSPSFSSLPTSCSNPKSQLVPHAPAPHTTRLSGPWASALGPAAWNALPLPSQWLMAPHALSTESNHLLSDQEPYMPPSSRFCISATMFFRPFSRRKMTLRWPVMRASELGSKAAWVSSPRVSHRCLDSLRKPCWSLPVLIPYILLETEYVRVFVSVLTNARLLENNQDCRWVCLLA